MIVSVIAFILVFGIVVISHEFGHFIIAKLNGIKVNEFAIGMGPALFKFTKGETVYALRLLPLGGACIFEGEDGVYSDKDGENKPQKVEGAFNEANVWARIATVFAGPFFNVILAFILALIVVGFAGSTTTRIRSLIDDYPAMQAGIQVGDEIVSINGEKVYIYDEVSFISANNRGEEIEIVVRRGNELVATTINPKYSQEDGRYLMGFSGGEFIECKGWNLIKYSAYQVRSILKLTVKSLLMMFKGKVQVDDLAGPVGMAQMINDTIETTKPYGISTVLLNLINFALLISANLGVMNLLPIPALDGGRLLFLIVEVLRGKPVPPDKEGIVHLVGFAALMALMVFVFYNDIMRLITGIVF